MLAFSRRRRMVHLAPASLVLAGLVVLSTAEARAGCHFSWIEPPNAPRSLVDLKILNIDDGLDRPHDGAPSRPDRSPCARGACSPAPAIPTTSTEPASRRAESWGTTVPAFFFEPGNAPGDLPDRDPIRPRHRTIPVDRPPR